MNETPVCPIHRRELVWRNGKYGDFWSCPAFASEGCRYTWKGEPSTQPVANVGTSNQREKLNTIKRELDALWSELENLL